MTKEHETSLINKTNQPPDTEQSGCYSCLQSIFSRFTLDGQEETEIDGEKTTRIDNELTEDRNIKANDPAIPVIIRDMHAHPWVMIKHLFHKGIIPQNQRNNVHQIGVKLLELEEICDAIKSEVSRSKSCAQIIKYTQLKEEFTILVKALNILTTHDIIAVGDTHADRGPNDELVTILFDHVIEKYDHTADKSFTILQSNHEEFRYDFFKVMSGSIITQCEVKKGQKEFKFRHEFFKEMESAKTATRDSFEGKLDEADKLLLKFTLKKIYEKNHISNGFCTQLLTRNKTITFQQFKKNLHISAVNYLLSQSHRFLTTLNTATGETQADSIIMNMYTMLMSCENEDDLDQSIDKYFESYKKHHEHAKVCVFNPDNNTLYTHAPCTLLDVLMEAFNAANALSDPTNTPPGLDDTRNLLCKSTATGSTLREFDWDKAKEMINGLTNPAAPAGVRKTAIKEMNICVNSLNEAQPMSTLYHNRDDGEIPIIWERRYKIAARILYYYIIDKYIIDKYIIDKPSPKIKIPISDYYKVMIAGLKNEAEPDQTLIHVTGHDDSREKFMRNLHCCLDQGRLDQGPRNNPIRKKLKEYLQNYTNSLKRTKRLKINTNEIFTNIEESFHEIKEAIAYVEKFFTKVLVYNKSMTQYTIRNNTSTYRSDDGFSDEYNMLLTQHNATTALRENPDTPTPSCQIRPGTS